MNINNFGVNQLVENAGLFNQTIDAGVSINDPIYSLLGVWFKADQNNPPRGVYQGALVVILFGKLITSGLVTNSFYYMPSAGGFSRIRSSVKIGKAISTTELLVDIDISSLELPRISGYMAGGFTAAPGVSISSIDKLDFSNENTSQLTSNLLSATRFGGSFNSNNFGFSVSLDSKTSKLKFSDDSRTNVTSALATGIEGESSFESSLAGYVTGGAPSRDIIEKLIFSNDNTNVLTGILLSTARVMLGSGYNSKIAGYSPGGQVVPAPISSSTIDKLIFGVDSNSAITSNLVAAKTVGTGYESKESGYHLAGTGNTNIEKLIFAIDFSIAISTALVLPARLESGGFNSTFNGFIAGGSIGGPIGDFDLINSLNFLNDSNSDITSTINQLLSGPTGFEN